MKNLDTELQQRKAQHLYRSRRVSDGPQQPEMIIDGKQVISFCSNDYLGLAGHPRVIAALRDGADSYGVGSGAAHLVIGHNEAHHALEEELAEFTGRPRALLFSTGYMANQGVITALLGRSDQVYQDRLNHASLIDAGLLSRARLRRFPHVAVETLQQQMLQQRGGEALVAIYCATKAAVISLTQSAGLDLIRHGINVNAIAPGVVDGEHWDGVDSLFAKYENRPIGEKKRLVGEAVPFGRMATAEDLTGMAVFLASSEADYIVAQTYNVDGGNWMS